MLGGVQHVVVKRTFDGYARMADCAAVAEPDLSRHRKGRRVEPNGEGHHTADSQVPNPVLQTRPLRLPERSRYPTRRDEVAGFWLWKVESMDEAIEWATRCPNPTGAENQLEIRLMYEADDCDDDFPGLRQRATEDEICLTAWAAYSKVISSKYHHDTHLGGKTMVQERPYKPMSGWPMLVIFLVMVVANIALFFFAARSLGAGEGLIGGVSMAGAVLLIFVHVLALVGFQAIAPNDARAYLLFGDYKGSTKTTGFYWVNPFFTKKKITLRIRNFETGSTTTPEQKSAEGKVVQEKGRTAGKPSKVNDKDGNPIEISAVVVWKVVNTAEALFEVDDYEDYVAMQSESALRNLASRHPYDSEDHEVSLRGNIEDISDQLKQDIQERLDKAGVEVSEARISHLAYAPEIAASMLQRQQAQAVVAARTKIVEGAVSMVEMALDELSKQKIVDLDEERRAAMVSNLLVVLCGDRQTQPVVNAGSLYQ